MGLEFQLRRRPRASCWAWGVEIEAELEVEVGGKVKLVGALNMPFVVEGGGWEKEVEDVAGWVIGGAEEGVMVGKAKGFGGGADVGWPKGLVGGGAEAWAKGLG